MKNLSVKLKITLWYTVFMTLFVILALFLLLFTANERILTEAKMRLKDSVIRSFYEIEYDEGVLKFDDDINYLGEGIYLSVYNVDGALIYGRIPSSFTGASMLVMDSLQQISQKGTVWYVYDYCQKLDGYGNLWVRGIVSQSPTDTFLRTILLLALFLFPFFILCIGLGGYSIIKKALLPLTSMAETAEMISTGTDLSKRIRLPAGNDEVHRLADTFDAMMDRLQASFEAEKQFTSDVSHELRTPVAVILSQCEYALDEQVSEAERLAALRSVSSQARKMTGLISRLLTLARAESGKLMLHIEPVRISELVELVCEDQREFAENKKITIHTQLEPDLTIQADEPLLIRLFINLISNSIHYGKENGNIWVTMEKDENRINVSVSDDGIGISAEHLDKIWNRFYQVDPARSASKSFTSSDNGYGLGLPMVKWIVNAHGGAITVESKPAVGTRFSFYFPCAFSSSFHLSEL